MKRIHKATAEGFATELLPWSIRSWTGTASDLKTLIRYEDKHLIVMYKPPQVLSQAERENLSQKDSMEFNILELLKTYRSEKEGSDFVGLVHRLDRPTSGLMVFAKHKDSLRRLNEMFEDRTVQKSYMAVVNGRVEGEGKFIDFLRKSERSKSVIFNPDRMIGSNGKEILQSVLSRLREGSLPLTAEPSAEVNDIDRSLVIGRMNYKALLSLDVNLHRSKPINPHVEKFQSVLDITLDTGRKHQIRAQLAAHNFPVVGDRKYGANQHFQTRDICLHAYRLRLPHPILHDKALDFSIAPPRVWSSRFPGQFIEAIMTLIDTFPQTS